MVNDKHNIMDMVLTVGWIEGKLEVLASLSDGRVKQELLNAKSNLANLADDLICMLEDEDVQDEPVTVVKLTGILHQEAMERYARKFSEQLPGCVVVVDNRVEDIFKMTRSDVERLVMALGDTDDGVTRDARV